MPSAARSSTAGGRAVRTKRTGTRWSAARAAGSSRSAPAGPSPTTTTRGLPGIYGVPFAEGTAVVVVVASRELLGAAGGGGLTKNACPCGPFTTHVPERGAIFTLNDV